MKAILMSIRPQWVAKILNGEKTIEIRKKFPSDYVGWVYIYCCKQRKNEIGCHINYEKVDGKVVARFWCNKVEEIIIEPFGEEIKDYEKEWCEKSCLSFAKLNGYLKGGKGYAIHITKLEIFDKPKEISEFTGVRPNGLTYMLERAPQSWQFITIGD